MNRDTGTADVVNMEKCIADMNDGADCLKLNTDKTGFMDWLEQTPDAVSE